MHVQDELRPILLRRMKEDVEDLPQKEEIVVRVQLTQQQRSFYKAIFAKQVRSCCSPSSPGCQRPAVQHVISGTHYTSYLDYSTSLMERMRDTPHPFQPPGADEMPGEEQKDLVLKDSNA